MQLSAGEQFQGWYEAPLGLGRTHFLLLVERVEQDGSWAGSGRDLTTLTMVGTRRQEERHFTVEGILQGKVVEFTKTLSDGSHSGIQYRGEVLEEDGEVRVQGEYQTTFSRLMIKMQIKEKFEMTRDK